MIIENKTGITYTKRDSVIVMQSGTKRAAVRFTLTTNRKGYSLDRKQLQEAFEHFELDGDDQNRAAFWLFEAAMFEAQHPFRIVSTQFGYEMFATLGDDFGFCWSDVAKDALVFDERDNREDKLAYWKQIAKQEGLDVDCIQIVEGA